MSTSFNFKEKKGFTLLELMVVVAIIGILAAIAIPAYTAYSIKSRVGELVADAYGPQLYFQEYASENGAFSPVALPTVPSFIPTLNAASMAFTGTTTSVAKIIVTGTAATGTPSSGPATVTLTGTLNGDGTITWVCVTAPTTFAPSTCP